MKLMKKIICVVMCCILLIAPNAVMSQAAVTVANVSKVTAATTASTVKLSWSKVKKATGYKVYKREDGKWKAVKTVKSGTTYTVTGLTAKESYKFAVRAYRKYNGKTYWSSKYKSVTAETKAFGTTPTPKATAEKTSITLKWSKLAGATGYRVYQYKDGDWVRIKSLTKNTYTVKSLTVDTTYRFKIKPYAKTSKGIYWGKMSEEVSVTTVDKKQTKITSATVGETTVTLNWSKVSGATGYRVYILKGEEWSKIKTTSSLKYKVTGLKSNTGYTFMVRAYKKTSSKTTYYTKSPSYTVTTEPAESDLEAYRIDKYKSILNSDSLYMVFTTDDEDLGNSPVEYARKNGNLYMKISMEGMSLRIFYVKKTNKMYMYIDDLRMYAEIPPEEMEGMDMSSIVDSMKIPDADVINVTKDVFDGKTVVCESFTDTSDAGTMKYYFLADSLIGFEKIIGDKTIETVRVQKISNSVSDKLFERPLFYIDISGLM